MITDGLDNLMGKSQVIITFSVGDGENITNIRNIVKFALTYFKAFKQRLENSIRSDFTQGVIGVISGFLFFMLLFEVNATWLWIAFIFNLIIFSEVLLRIIILGKNLF